MTCIGRTQLSIYHTRYLLAGGGGWRTVYLCIRPSVSNMSLLTSTSKCH